MTLHCMIDLETAGRTPDGAILAIGVAAFDPRVFGVREVFEWRIDFADAARHGTIEAETVLWWMEQSEGVRNAMFGVGAAGAGRHSLLQALSQFASWYKMLNCKRAWANGTTFDMTILEHAYKQVGMRSPYHYRDVRDMRLFRDVVPEDAYPLQIDMGPAHTAVADAKKQVILVQTAYAHLGWDK